jgi:hypothetical protein
VADIFISYRRPGDAHAAGRLYDELTRAIPTRYEIFLDVDNISPGSDFAEVLKRKVADCFLLLAVIGPGWLEAKDTSDKKRLDDPHDFVRIEISTALASAIRVVPVLMDGAQLPDAKYLPDDLKPLVTRHATRISHERFGSDVREFVSGLRRDNYLIEPLKYELSLFFCTNRPRSNFEKRLTPSEREVELIGRAQ